MNQSWNSTFIWLVSWNIECRQGVLGTFISKFWAPIVIDFTERCTSFPKKKESQRSTQKHAVQPTPFLQTKNQTRHFLHIQMKWNYPAKTETRKKKLFHENEKSQWDQNGPTTAKSVDRDLAKIEVTNRTWNPWNPWNPCKAVVNFGQVQ